MIDSTTSCGSSLDDPHISPAPSPENLSTHLMYGSSTTLLDILDRVED